jgi:hypothetical protein
MTPRWLRIVLARRNAVLVSATAILACGGAATKPAPIDSSTGDCRVRTEHVAPNAKFTNASASADTIIKPECVPSCGDDQRRDGFRSVASLPAGACGSADTTCDMSAYAPCACSPAEGPVSVYRCSCEAARWHCVVVSQGAAVCLPCDGGP